MNGLRHARPVCDRCLRPQRTCICDLVIPVHNTVEVLVLQHPLEAGQAKGSARLLQLCLKHCRLAVGESFAVQELDTLLHAPLDDAVGPGAPGRIPILLYPDFAGGVGAPPQLPQPPQTLIEPARLRLVVLDATWRKSRKMLHCNPLLQRLPRLALRDAPPSRYRIRKAHAPHQLSTLEATCHALMQLEGEGETARPLLDAFDRFVARQAAHAAGASD